MILVIDNIDSFVYNLVQYVEMSGEKVRVVRKDERKEKVEKMIKEEGVSHIIISPGPKKPMDAGLSNEIILRFGDKIPILGVCLGHQCICHVFGGKIRKARVLKHGKVSKIRHNERCEIFRGVRNPFTATRYHSLVADDLPECLEVTAISEDDDEIMGVKHKKYPIYGVQFHPESILTGEGMKMMRNFLSLR